MPVANPSLDSRYISKKKPPAPPPYAAPTIDPNTYQGWGFQLMPSLGALAGPDQNIAQSFYAGTALANEFYPFNSLGRINDQLQPWHADILGQYQAQIPYSRTGAADYSMNRLNTLADSAGYRDPVLQQSIDSRVAGLGGLSAPEMTAAREAGEVGLNRALQTALSTLRQGQSPGLTGPASNIATAPAINAFAQGQADLERNLMLDNIAIRDQRRRELEGLVGGLADQEFQRRYQAGGLYDQSLGQREQFEADQRAQNLDRYAGYQRGLEQFFTQNQMYNLDQLAAEKAGQLGLIFGAGQFGAAQQGRREGVDIAKEGLDVARETAKFNQPLTNYNYSYSTPGASDAANARRTYPYYGYGY